MEAERTKLIETLRDQGIKNQEVLDCALHGGTDDRDIVKQL